MELVVCERRYLMTPLTSIAQQGYDIVSIYWLVP
jgi:hypothetical protein